jgi:hypothetical protein
MRGATRLEDYLLAIWLRWVWTTNAADLEIRTAHADQPRSHSTLGDSPVTPQSRSERDEIYAVGNSRDANVSIEKFLGRERSIEPFLKKIGVN